MCLVAMVITYLWPNWPPRLINTRLNTKISHRQKNVIIPYVVNYLCNPYGPIGVGYNVYNQLTLLIMNHGCNLIVSPFNTFQARFKELRDVDLSSTLKVYKIFAKVSQGPWLRGNSALGPLV